MVLLSDWSVLLLSISLLVNASNESTSLFLPSIIIIKKVHIRTVHAAVDSSCPVNQGIILINQYLAAFRVL